MHMQILLKYITKKASSIQSVDRARCEEKPLEFACSMFDLKLKQLLYNQLLMLYNNILRDKKPAYCVNHAECFAVSDRVCWSPVPGWLEIHSGSPSVLAWLMERKQLLLLLASE